MSTMVEERVDEGKKQPSRSHWLGGETESRIGTECVHPRVPDPGPTVLEGIGEGALACSEMGDAVFWVAADETILSFNDAAVRFFGPIVDQERFSEWVRRAGFSQSSGGSDSAGMVFPFRDCLSQRVPIVRDLGCRSRWKRDARWFRVACVFYSKKSGIDQVQVVLRDLSELRRTKAMVSKLQLVEAQSPNPTLQVTADGVIAQANPAAQRLLDTSPESNRIFALMPDISEHEIGECIREGGTLENEIEIKGRVFQFNMIGMPNLGWAHVYGFEISSFRATEARLKEAKTRAEASTRLKSEFLANMSHEIRTPMNGILGMASFLMDSDLDDHQREFADTIHSSGESLLAIINDILDFSKLEAQRLHLENVEFELSRVVGDTMDLLARQGQSKGLEILVDFAADVPERLVGDPVRLRQILNNLIGNAIKFTEEGDVVLTVSCAGTSTSGIELEFSVSDSGIGIPDDKLKKLFRPFSQAESSTTRKYGGTGLGLVISKTLVELMGGEMRVESTLGIGSRFCFSARFGCGSNVERQKREQGSLAGHRVLVIDGHSGSRRILSQVLKRWDAACIAVGGFEDGLTQLSKAREAERPIEVILLDVRRLEEWGNDGSEAIRQAAGEVTPIVFLLGGVDDTFSKVRREHSLGDELLCKPIKPNRLLELLRSHVPGVEGETRTNRSTSVREEKSEQKFADLKVLLVEDNVVNVKVATEQLRRLGVSCDCAYSGAEALKKIERHAYDVVLMDCQLPVLDGFQATSEIRSREREEGIEPGEGLHIVAMTANAMDGDREKCLAPGMNEYLSKPVRLERLREVLETVTPRSRCDAGDTPTSERGPRSGSDGIEALVSEVGVELAQEILTAFVEDSGLAIVALKKDVEKKDSKSVLRRAHTLKGSSATCGSRSIVYTCLQIETLAKEGDFGQLPGLVEELAKELDSAVERIEAFRAQQAEQAFA